MRDFFKSVYPIVTKNSNSSSQAIPLFSTQMTPKVIYQNQQFAHQGFANFQNQRNPVPQCFTPQPSQFLQFQPQQYFESQPSQSQFKLAQPVAKGKGKKVVKKVKKKKS